jgi:ribosomal protein S18 acetylase RimI-like enzyme
MDYRFDRVSDKSLMTDILKEYNESFPVSIDSRVGNLAQYAEKLINNSQAYVLFYNNTSVGTVIFYANDKQNKAAYLTMIAVKQQFRGKGFASLLLSLCEDKSKEAGMIKLILEVDLRNENAVGFYYNKGFKYLDKASENSIHLIKELV